MKTNPQTVRPRGPAVRIFAAFTFAAILLAAIAGLAPTTERSPVSHLMPTAGAGSVYAPLASGNLTFSISAANADVINSNDDWSGFASVEGYFGQNLTGTHGVDPQTVVGTEFPVNALPGASRQINANKGNPSAYNAGGLAEFDRGDYLAIGFQGNVQANPYLVFYVNSIGVSNITITYRVTDIDAGSNNAVSPVALQYRVGSTGPFTNLPAGYIADATDGPNIGGRVTNKTVTLPAAAGNQPQVQIRIITTNAAGPGGGSTPDEWIGVNNIVVGSNAPTSAPVEVAGRVLAANGRSVARAIVRATDEMGQTRSSITNTFGYYRINGLTAGRSYVMDVKSRTYLFDPLFITANESLSGVDFVERPRRITAAEASPLISTAKR